MSQKSREEKIEEGGKGAQCCIEFRGDEVWGVLLEEDAVPVTRT